MWCCLCGAVGGYLISNPRKVCLSVGPFGKLNLSVLRCGPPDHPVRSHPVASGGIRSRYHHPTALQMSVYHGTERHGRGIQGIQCSLACCAEAQHLCTFLAVLHIDTNTYPANLWLAISADSLAEKGSQLLPPASCLLKAAHRRTSRVLPAAGVGVGREGERGVGWNRGKVSTPRITKHNVCAYVTGDRGCCAVHCIARSASSSTLVMCTGLFSSQKNLEF